MEDRLANKTDALGKGMLSINVGFGASWIVCMEFRLANQSDGLGKGMGSLHVCSVWMSW